MAVVQTSPTLLGNISINPQGEYSSGTQYERLDVVTYNGSGYICIQDCQNKPVTNTSYWYLLVSKGDTYEVTEEDLQRIALQIEEDASSLFNQLVAQKTSEFNTNATQKTNDFDSNATSKTSDFNSNATSKTSDFNTNATAKTTGFNQNATEKTTGFDANYNDKVGLFNGNATTKTTDFNTNATEKTSAFDEHVSEQTEDFDEHVESYSHRLDLLESNFEEKQATPSDNVTVTDSINGIVKKASLIGKTEQDTTSISGGDEYDSPSPSHPQPINNVTGNVITESSNINEFSASKIVRDTNNENVYITQDGKEIRYTLGSNRVIIKPFGEAKQNQQYTYILIVRNPNSSAKTFKFNAYYSDGTSNTIINQEISDEEYHTLTGITTVNKTLLYVTSVSTSSSTAYIKIDGSQIREGATITDYIEHKGKRVTFPLATGQKMYEGDYLASDGIHHVRKQRELTGTGTITYNSNYGMFQISLNTLNGKVQTTAKSNYFGNDDNFQIKIGNNSKYIWITDSNNYFGGSVETFTNFLSTNTPVIEYLLNSEEIEPYTEAQQTAWNELQKLETYKNTTIVYTISDGVYPNADFVYLVDPTVLINSRLDDLEQAVASLGANV